MKNPTLKKIWATYHAERADAMTTVEALAEHMKSGSIYPVRCVQPGNPISVILAGKTNPLNEDDLADFVALQKTKADSPNSWSLDVKDLNPDTLDLSVKNPNKKEEKTLREPSEIIAEMQELNKQSGEILKELIN